MGMTHHQSDETTVVGDPLVFDHWLGETGVGPTVAIKDVMDMAGLPTRAASRAFQDRAPAEKDAEVVARLRGNGCHFSGKTTLHELAYGVTGLNVGRENPLNPHYPDLIPGGSSSGSAITVAAGQCDFALGTDTGGSVRVPAACCGIYGLKPTFGRLSRKGLTPVNSSLDCIGPLATSVAILQDAMQLMDPTFRAISSADVLNLAWIETGADGKMADQIKEALAQTSCQLTSIDLPELATAHQAGITIMAREMYDEFADLAESGMLAPDVAARVLRGAEISPSDLDAAEKIRSAFQDQLDDLLNSYDLLALPTLPDVPPTIEDATDLMAMVKITCLSRPFNLSGHPAVSMPVGHLDGRPVSLQLVAKRHQDEKLLASAILLDRLMKTTEPPKGANA